MITVYGKDYMEQVMAQSLMAMENYDGSSGASSDLAREMRDMETGETNNGLFNKFWMSVRVLYITNDGM